MRIPKNWVHILARRIIDNLIAKKLIEIAVPANNLIEEAKRLIIDELMVEERLNDEVRQILKKYEFEIERGRLDYRKLFEMTKQKLIKEKNIVI